MKNSHQSDSTIFDVTDRAIYQHVFQPDHWPVDAQPHELVNGNIIRPVVERSETNAAALALGSLFRNTESVGLKRKILFGHGSPFIASEHDRFTIVRAQCERLVSNAQEIVETDISVGTLISDYDVEGTFLTWEHQEQRISYLARHVWGIILNAKVGGRVFHPIQKQSDSSRQSIMLSDLRAARLGAYKQGIESRDTYALHRRTKLGWVVGQTIEYTFDEPTARKKHARRYVHQRVIDTETYVLDRPQPPTNRKQDRLKSIRPSFSPMFPHL